MLQRLERALGAPLVLVGLLYAFLTALCARIGAGILSGRVARLT